MIQKIKWYGIWNLSNSLAICLFPCQYLASSIQNHEKNSWMVNRMVPVLSSVSEQIRNMCLSIYYPRVKHCFDYISPAQFTSPWFRTCFLLDFSSTSCSHLIGTAQHKTGCSILVLSQNYNHKTTTTASTFISVFCIFSTTKPCYRAAAPKKTIKDILPAFAKEILLRSSTRYLGWRLLSIKFIKPRFDGFLYRVSAASVPASVPFFSSWFSSLFNERFLLRNDDEHFFSQHCYHSRTPTNAYVTYIRTTRLPTTSK